MSWKTNRRTKKVFKSEIQEALERAGLGKNFNPTIPILEAKIEQEKIRSRPFAPEGQQECICRGECIAEGTRRPIDEAPCPYRGFKTLGGYCRTCYKGIETQKGGLK